MTTGADIVNQALKKAGILGLGQVADASDLTDGLADLNDMVSQWVTQRWMVWNLLDIACVSTAANSYTVGPAGNFNVTRRPDRIEAAYQRQVVGAAARSVDTPLRVISAREEYSRIAVKQLQGFGKVIFYDAAYPLGVIYPYPVPQATIYEIHLILKNTIPVFTQASVLSVPEQYVAALKFNLARRLRQSYGKGLRPDPELNRLATDALDIIKQANIQIPQLMMPAALVPGSGYNILSDQFGDSSP